MVWYYHESFMKVSWYGIMSFMAMRVSQKNAEHERLKGTFQTGSVSSHDLTRQPYFRLQKAQGKDQLFNEVLNQSMQCLIVMDPYKGEGDSCLIFGLDKC